ncbi:AfsR/SARP family transcriptional regulator [Winogradskyella vincentii]|uniref:Bacterial transcriptional activator domain-containing protein n=1 Tax=Winogradskyella vincentii TaxID=2877122 RepID=A0ABS7Y2S4_9FLAO|nr:bacterial transcriptional activator domain-containing protein [Winogradskyella vincentii]MCA0153147.1 bacterial transcriptional activator domain-containing protein [Winogradskyella vincentii]
MSHLQNKLLELKEFRENAKIRIQTLGQFNLWRDNEKVDSKQWGRDKTVQLLQYLISNRHRHALHKESIMEHLWEEGDDRDFKVALHGVNKVLEPNRPSRTEPSFVIRQGVSYQLDLDKIWIDVEALEQYIIIGNEAYAEDLSTSKEAYKSAIALYQGVYLPNRIFEDWSSEEREKIQILILGAYVILAEILLNENPLESIRLAQCAIAIDKTWEDAYRLQMQAYLIKGNRPQAIKAYQKCADVLDEEYGIDPLPATKKVLQEIESI